LVGHPLQVVGHSLGACLDFGCDLADGDLPRAGNGVKDAKSCVARENPEQSGEFGDFGSVDQGPLGKCGRDEVGGGG